MFDGTYSNAQDEDNGITIESLSEMINLFKDRIPAPLRSIKVHPDYFDIFMADLREYGAVKSSNSPAFLSGVSIIKDENVPFGEMKQIFAGDEGER
jgi:hypothetical protein